MGSLRLQHYSIWLAISSLPSGLAAFSHLFFSFGGHSFFEPLCLLAVLEEEFRFLKLASSTGSCYSSYLHEAQTYGFDSSFRGWYWSSLRSFSTVGSHTLLADFSSCQSFQYCVLELQESSDELLPRLTLAWSYYPQEKLLKNHLLTLQEYFSSWSVARSEQSSYSSSLPLYSILHIQYQQGGSVASFQWVIYCELSSELLIQEVGPICISWTKYFTWCVLIRIATLVQAREYVRLNFALLLIGSMWTNSWLIESFDKDFVCFGPQMVSGHILGNTRPLLHSKYLPFGRHTQGL